MASVTCLCGAKMSDTSFPSPHTSYMIKDARLDAITNYSGEDDSIPRDKESVEVLLCWAAGCGRLLVEDKSTGRYVFYKREEAK
jgi:hypothetical protein